mmetsp:Transcript_135095/g.376357  ORF Transcript_135095/g.376357 Transcript_135095/m.376357 type:complete len:126 (-) Transcript_135095:64-441(-)
MPLLELAAAGLLLAGARLGASPEQEEASTPAACEGEEPAGGEGPPTTASVAAAKTALPGSAGRPCSTACAQWGGRTPRGRSPLADDTEGDGPWVILDAEPGSAREGRSASPPGPWELVDRPPSRA